MNLNEIKNIENIPGLSEGTALNMLEAAVVCLCRQQHNSGVSMPISGVQNYNQVLEWDTLFTNTLDRAYADQEVATELGAVCISILIALSITPYTIIERSRKKTGFDYWLGDKNATLPFVHSARLEISGIFCNPQGVQQRVRYKLRQTSQSDNLKIPAYVSVVEFSQPTACFILK